MGIGWKYKKNTPMTQILFYKLRNDTSYNHNETKVYAVEVGASDIGPLYIPICC